MTTPAYAQDVPMTAEEFNNQIVGRTVRFGNVGAMKLTVDLELLDGGKAVVSSGYNDVGRWRPYETAGYCVMWNKQAPTERCFVYRKREGKLLVVAADGSGGSFVESIR